MKADVRTYRRWYKRLALRVLGTPYLPTMRRVTKAVDAGFDRIQRMYLAEETTERDPATGSVTVTTWLLMEFIPGESLKEHREFAPQIPEALRELHKHGLVQSDPHYGNFIVSDGKVKVIDLLFFNQPFILVWPRDVIKVEDVMRIPFPLDSAFDRMVCRAMRAKTRLRRTSRQLAQRLRDVFHRKDVR